VSEEREQLESICRDIANVIRAELPQGVGFALILFDFGDAGNMAYMSTAARAETIKLLRELAGNLERSILPGGTS
jgi:hypothetical protein